MKISLIPMLCLFIVFTSCNQEQVSADYQIIPLPQQIDYTDDKPFELDKNTVITYPEGNEALKRTADFLAGYIKDFTGLDLSVSHDTTGKMIRLQSSWTHDSRDAYVLKITPQEILIDGASDVGTFYGVQTLRKSIPAHSTSKTVSFPTANITDFPRFEYRGAMLDIGRHMFPVDFVKKYIDLLALHNINYFHWHLTDDQGWRIEIKKYPKLTEVGSIRKETLVGHLILDTPHQFDGKPYGGYYTQEEVKEIVRYAQDRFITIVPEIDLPGHMLAALTSYPELGCTGGPYEVGTKWGVFEDILCAGNEQTYDFIEGVFDEITELFPSKYIHIGGDEAPKTRWKVCPKCQAKIKELGLVSDNEHSAETKLQSYVVSRVEKMLQNKGREIIGWDEVLEGELISPEVIIMSWRGTEGGIAAAQKGHKAIMAPHYNLYLDYNQGEDISKEPLSIGEYISVRKVYDYEPVPNELTSEQAKYIIGTQGNLWTEYIETPPHAEYMLLPRLAALSEIQWTDPKQKDYPSFLKRLGNMIAIYKEKGYNYAKHVYGISSDISPAPNKDGIQLALSTVGRGEIFYTLDGTTPSKNSTLYTSPIKLSESVVLKAIAVHPDTSSAVFEFVSNFNKATYKSVEILSTMNPKYVFKGAQGLVDGYIGAPSYVDGNWVGFSGKRGLEAIIDLKQPTDISSVKVGSLNDAPNWIFAGSAMKVYVSDDKEHFSLVAEHSVDLPSRTSPIERRAMKTEFSPTKARYIKVEVPSTIIPSWHEGSGGPSLLFVDEIEVN